MNVVLPRRDDNIMRLVPFHQVMKPSTMICEGGNQFQKRLDQFIKEAADGYHS